MTIGTNSSGQFFAPNLNTNGIIYVGSGGVFASTSAGSSGQLFQATGSTPGLTTATYPSTAGTSGNALKSNGTNWNSSLPNALSASGNINSATFKNIHTTPVTLVSAAGANTIIWPIVFGFRFNYGGNNVFSSGGNLFVSINGSPVSLTFSATSYIGSSTVVSVNFPEAVYSNIAVASNINLPLTLTTASSNPGGNAAGDNSIDWWLTYAIMTF